CPDLNLIHYTIGLIYSFFNTDSAVIPVRRYDGIAESYWNPPYIAKMKTKVV
ncbi:hypothetical protein HMPREF3156_00793, partial [Neisseria sp. HMSC06F02]